VNGFVAHVKGKQQQPSGLQHSQHFPEYQTEIVLGHIYDCLERHDPGECSSRKIEGHHISLEEANVRIQLASLFQHFPEKDPDRNARANAAKIALDVTRPTAQIAHFATACNFTGETIEQFAVKRLLLKLVDKSTQYSSAS